MKPTIILAAAACLLASCKKEEAAATSSGHGTPATAAPSAELTKILASAPGGDVKAIHTIRTTAKPGDEITISGKIMGSTKPFVEGRAAFILGDKELLTACNEIPGDSCDTPWDVCCETAEEKKQGTATIQIVGADGRVLKENLEGAGGLEKLAEVTVTGKVAEGSKADALVVNATAIKAGK
jgi:co-chaperonin GroES (HSP10)